MNPNEIKIRCSAFGQIMTEPKLKADKDAGNLSETAKTYLKNLYREIKYKRHQEFSSKYTEKGLAMEEDGLTLLSKNLRKFLKKNAERLTNDFVTGEPDAYLGESITTATEGFDVKCPYSLWTLPFKDDKLPNDYYYQAMGYMWLTGANRWTIAYTLVNGTANGIINEKNRIWYSMGTPDDFNKDYIKKRREIEKNMIFDYAQFRKDNPNFDLDIKQSEWTYDIPEDERVVKFVIERDEDVIAKMQAQVIKCRQWLQSTFPNDFEGEIELPVLLMQERLSE
jgi:hypothetical protein